MARLDARWDNFWHRGQAWYGFDLDGPSAGPSTVEGSFPADAVVLKTAQEALGADATLRAVLSSSLTADAVLRAPVAAVANVEAILLRGQGDSLEADAVLLVTGAGSYAVDADLQATQAGQWITEATKRAVIEAGSDVDAVLRGVHLEDFTADAAIGVVELGSFGVDACLSVTSTGDVSLDAVVLAHLTSSFDVDAIVGSGGAVVSDSFDVDAFVQPYFRVDASISTNPTFKVDASIISPLGIKLRSSGTWTTWASSTSTPTLPAHQIGDMLIVRAFCKPYSATITCATTGWNPVGDKYQTGTTGNFNGGGSVAFRAFYKIATSASEANPVITWGVSAAPGAVKAMVFKKGFAERWVTPVGAGGGDMTVPDPFYHYLSTYIPTVGGDMVDFFIGSNGYSYYLQYANDQSVLQTGATFDSPVPDTDGFATTASNDLSGTGGYRLALAGASTGTAAWVNLYSSSNSKAGGVWATRLRVFPTYFSVDADLLGANEKRGSFSVEAFKADTTSLLFITRSIIQVGESGSFSLDAAIFSVEGQVEAGGSFSLKALVDDRLTHVFEGKDGWPVDAYIDSYWGEQFFLDATIVGTGRTGSFSAGADISLPGEQRSTFVVESILGAHPKAIFNVYAAIVQIPPFRVDAIIVPGFSVDAVLAYLTPVEAFDVDAVIRESYAGGLTANAVIADAAGSFWGFRSDAVVMAEKTGEFEVVAHIAGSRVDSFSVDALLSKSFTVSAFIQPFFSVDAYIMGSDIVVYPPSQTGGDGASVSPGTFYSPTADFDPTVTSIVIEGYPYTVTSVIDSYTVVVSPDILTPGSGLDWYVPSGSPTDPLGNDHPVVTRRFRVRILIISPPDRGVTTELTPDVMWAQTEFTQAARFGPGSFRITLRGSFDFVGGEEIHVEIDDFRVFGGYVLQVEKGYVFSDAYNETTTTLLGSDYNILFDRLLVYNDDWVTEHGSSGEYRNLRTFPKGTSDQDIIIKTVRDYLVNMRPRGFDFTTYVDEVDTPAPERPWAMQAGTKFREVMQSISMITGGVWWIDAYKNLHYHDGSTVTAPWPITDGDGGIAARNLKVTSDISPMISDAFVWGTLAYNVEGEIMFSRQPADRDDQVQYWERKISRLQDKIDRIKLIAPEKRTLRQKTDLAAYLKTLDIYMDKLLRAQKAALENLPQGIYGQWQHAEFRQDIHHQDWLNRRAKAIFWRYSVPVVKAEATVFTLGFGAGQVASVVSSAHGIADELVIRQMTIKFVVGKEPFEGRYYAVPQFDLFLGLDPLDPWDVYDYLPFPGRSRGSKETPQRKWDKGGDGEEPTPPDECNVSYGWVYLDTFDARPDPQPLEYYDGSEWGYAENDRDELRPWTYPGGGSG